MKKIYPIFTVIAFISLSLSLNAQAFRKGSMIVSISEGTTWSKYTTSDISQGPTPIKIGSRCIKGDRDPLIFEYGISDKWSLGMSSGADIYKLNSNEFYGLRTSNNEVKAVTAEFTLDGNYHFFVGPKLDLSVFGGVGILSVNIKGNDADMGAYNYVAKGTTLRAGMRVRYYFWKRFGVFGMISSYLADCSTKNERGNTMGNNYSTSLNGFAIETGMCFRLTR